MYNVEYGYYPDKIDNVTHCSADPIIDTRYCLKASTYTTLLYTGHNQTFTVTATKSGISYRIAEGLAPFAFTPTPITGTAAVGQVLTASNLVPAGANGTVNTAVNGSQAYNSTPTITATPNSGYMLSSWSGSTGCSGSASHTITMDANKTCTASFVVDPWANWYAGVSGVLVGKHVYKTNLGSNYMYKTTDTANAALQSSGGALVDPQANPGVDFSAYPAQNACKAIGGQTTNYDKASYGNNLATVLIRIGKLVVLLLMRTV